METLHPLHRAHDQILQAKGRKKSVYAIAFDLDTAALERHYHVPSITGAWKDIEKILTQEGFDHTQGSLYMGDPDRINAVTCVLAAQRLARELPWFSKSVSDIRMFRIEDSNDLGPAVKTPIDLPFPK